MNYLLDTHILLWARFDRKKLTAVQKAIIESSVDQKFISAITVWEISLKYSLGKLELGGLTPDEFIAGTYKLGISPVMPTAEHYSSFYLLPKLPDHKDPFDRMLIWHAMQSGLTLISSDKQFPKYKPHGLQLA